MPTFDIESSCTGLVAGIDEVGRGCWAGPVVAAAFIFLDPSKVSNTLLEKIDDSKRLSARKRAQVFEELLQLNTCVYNIGMASVEEIDSVNILQATFLAMRRAVEGLSISPSTLLIDGKMIPDFPTFHVRPIIDGDAISLSIAAASIIAKVTRDTLMGDLSTEYPMYGWEKNMGYGTQLHTSALYSQGLSPHHRRSFLPMRDMLLAV